MKYEYEIGKSNNWKESAIVGSLGGILCVGAGVVCTIMPAIFCVLGVVVFVAGITGFLKRTNK